MLCIDDYPTAKVQWDRFIEELRQLGHEFTRMEGLTSKPPAATARGSSQRRQRRGMRQECGEEGHSARDCRAPKEEPTVVPAAEEPSGAAEQPEISPTDAIHVADFEGEGCLPQVPAQNLHAQTRGAEPEAISGEPGAIGFGQSGDPNTNTSEGVAHAEPDSMPEEEIDLNANAPVHPVGMGLDVLLEEDGTAGENASIEGDEVPHVELQEPGVSHLTTPEVKFLTSSSSSPHIIPEAASTQRSPAVNTGTPAIPDPEGSTDLVPPPPPRPPDKAAEPNADRPPKYIRAPTGAGGQSESLWSAESHRAMDQMSPSSARASEGKTPLREAHGRPPDFPDQQM